jgi:uncharacterized protein
MKVAVIGTGISGMVAAYPLSRRHGVVVFEAEDYIGGHTQTIDVSHDGTIYPVDTGVVVFNEKTCPDRYLGHLSRLNCERDDPEKKALE